MMSRICEFIKKNKFLLFVLSVGLLFIYFNNENYSFKLESKEQSYWRYDTSIQRYFFDKFRFSLEPGEYSLKFFYDPSSVPTDISYEVVDCDQVSSSNTTCQTIATGVMQANSDSSYIEFSINQPSTELRLAFSNEFSFYSFTINMLNDAFMDIWFVMGAFLLGLIGCYLFVKNKRIDLIVILLICILISLPVLQSKLLTGADLHFHMARIQGIAQGLRAFEFPVRVNTVFSYGIGSADPIYYPNLFLYVPALLCVSGCSLLFSFQFFVVLINVFTGLLSFWAFRKLFDKKIAFILTVLYLVNPFRLNDIYLRYAMGEVLALCFLPAYFAGLIDLLRGEGNSWKTLCFSAWGILNSHLLSVVLTALVTILFIITQIPFIVSHISVNKVKTYIKTILMTLGMSLGFLVPLLDHMGTEIGILDSNAIGASAQGIFNLFSFNSAFHSSTTIGLASLVILVICCVWLIARYSKKRFNENDSLNLVCIFIALLCLYFASTYFPWNFIASHLPSLYEMFNSIQFSWRILGYAVVMILLGFGYLLMNIDSTMIHSKFIYNGFAVISVLSLVSVHSTFSDVNKELVAYNGRNEMVCYSNILNYDYFAPGLASVDYTALENNQNRILSSKPIQIMDFQKSGSTITLKVDAPEDTKIQFPVYDYRFYQATVNGETVPIDYSDTYFVQLEFDGSDDPVIIQLSYHERILYIMANAISLLFVLYMMLNRNIVRINMLGTINAKIYDYGKRYK